MSEVVFSFDVEDLANRGAADDAVVILADILSEEGVKGCFNVVSSLIRIWHDHNRYDVLDALSRHEIGSHSRWHTWHPTAPEVAEKESWNDAFVWSVYQQKSALNDLQKISPCRPILTYVTPGNSFAAPDLAALFHCGLKINSGSLFKKTGGMGIWYSGLLNLEEQAGLDAILIAEGIGGINARLPEWRQNRRLILCTHPNFIPLSTFWDAENLKGTNCIRWGNWRQSTLRDKQDVARIYRDFKDTVRLLKKEFIPTTLQAIYTGQAIRPVIKREWIGELSAQTANKLKFARCAQITWSAAEILKAAAFFLHDPAESCDVGFMDGPHDFPRGVKEQTTMTRQAITAAARDVYEANYVPAAIDINGVSIGPRDFLAAAAQIFADREQAVIYPQVQIPVADDFDIEIKLDVNGWMYPENWTGIKVRNQLQALLWTMRPETADCEDRDAGA
ncbi:MAG: hypothetical protein SCM11_09495 [Bacillota bacterium]|nr:hypothetical protein [Bacillota bacterium]